MIMSTFTEISTTPDRLASRTCRMLRHEVALENRCDSIGILTRIRASITVFRRSLRLREDEARLQRLDDRTLKDIGICRSEIPYVVRQVREAR